jgi:glycosyltransferase involved in cell wall biosynthesis
MHSLTVVIPAFNEEEAIDKTIHSCLDARKHICEISGVQEIEIIVVSDGSTDRTAEIAQSFQEIQVIVFKNNKGYGAAIKEGFRRASGTILGFLDADGTCNPLHFGNMCQLAIHGRADVVLGSRLCPGSKMPFVRRIGNRIFAFLLGFLCGRRITDTASGMRVLRREALNYLYPLPDGLHFTPSMTARAMLNGLNLAEIPMSYEKRIGTSKLNLLGDGIRFSRTIVEAVLCYRPERLFLLGFSFLFLVSLLYALYPIEFYFKNFRIEEWMIYRFLMCFLLGLSGFCLLCGAALSYRMADLGPRLSRGHDFWAHTATRLFEGKTIVVFVSLVLSFSIFLLKPGILQYVTTGKVHLHWSRIFVGCFGVLITVQSLVTAILLRVLKIWTVQDLTRDPDPI